MSNIYYVILGQNKLQLQYIIRVNILYCIQSVVNYNLFGA